MCRRLNDGDDEYGSLKKIKLLTHVTKSTTFQVHDLDTTIGVSKRYKQ